MARTRTRAQLRQEARQLSDQENSLFCSDAEIDRYLNEGISDLWDLIVSSEAQEFVIKEGTINLVGGTSVYSLPADFYVLYGVDINLNASDRVPIRPYTMYDRNIGSFYPSVGIRAPYQEMRYRLQGSINDTSGVYTPQIRFTPAPLGAVTVTVTYVPHAPVLDNDADVWDGINGWEEYPAYYAAIKMMNKEESDSSQLQLQLERLRQRIEILAARRDMGWPETVTDVEY